MGSHAPSLSVSGCGGRGQACLVCPHGPQGPGPDSRWWQGVEATNRGSSRIPRAVPGIGFSFWPPGPCSPYVCKFPFWCGCRRGWSAIAAGRWAGVGSQSTLCHQPLLWGETHCGLCLLMAFWLREETGRTQSSQETEEGVAWALSFLGTTSSVPWPHSAGRLFWIRRNVGLVGW